MINKDNLQQDLDKELNEIRKKYKLIIHGILKEKTNRDIDINLILNANFYKRAENEDKTMFLKEMNFFNFTFDIEEMYERIANKYKLIVKDCWFNIEIEHNIFQAHASFFIP